MATEHSRFSPESDEDPLYATTGTSPLRSSIRDVVTGMVGNGKSSTLSAMETMDVMKTEVCTLCRRQNFMDCEGECTQDCDIIHQVVY